MRNPLSRASSAAAGRAQPAAATVSRSSTTTPSASQPAQQQPQAPAAAAAAGANLGPLPSGWEMKMTPSGKIYFVDHSEFISLESFRLF